MSTSDNNFNWDPLSRYLTTVGVHLFGGIVGPFVSPLNQGIIYYDVTSQRFKASENGGAAINLLTGGGGGSAYQIIQEEGVSLPQQDTLNFVGAAITAADGPGAKTTVTLSQSPASASVVGTGRLITAGSGLTGGGDLSADRTLAVDGTVVRTTRLINTTAPLAGGGDLSANRTLSIPQATSVVDGYLSAADWVTFNAKVPPTRQVIAGTGLTGGGALSADVTLSLSTPVSIANGGTNAITANAAINNLLPSQTGNNGKFLTTDGSNTSWATPAGAGTIGGSGAANQLAYFTDATDITSVSNLSIDPTTFRLLIQNLGGGVSGGLALFNNSAGNPDIRLINSDNVSGLASISFEFATAPDTGVVGNASISYNAVGSRLDIINNNAGPVNFFTQNFKRAYINSDGALALVGMPVEPPVSNANEATIYYNDSTNKVRVSKNGAAYADLI